MRYYEAPLKWLINKKNQVSLNRKWRKKRITIGNLKQI